MWPAVVSRVCGSQGHCLLQFSVLQWLTDPSGVAETGPWEGGGWTPRLVIWGKSILHNNDFCFCFCYFGNKSGLFYLTCWFEIHFMLFHTSVVCPFLKNWNIVADVLVSGVEQSASVIYIYICIFFFRCFPLNIMMIWTWIPLLTITFFFLVSLLSLLPAFLPPSHYISFRYTDLLYATCVHYGVVIATSLVAIHHHKVDPPSTISPSPQPPSPLITTGLFSVPMSLFSLI